jgi:hypothetical protein
VYNSPLHHTRYVIRLSISSPFTHEQILRIIVKDACYMGQLAQTSLRARFYINPLTPELNPSA